MQSMTLKWLNRAWKNNSWVTSYFSWEKNRKLLSGHAGSPPFVFKSTFHNDRKFPLKLGRMDSGINFLHLLWWIFAQCIGARLSCQICLLDSGAGSALNRAGDYLKSVKLSSLWALNKSANVLKVCTLFNQIAMKLEALYHEYACKKKSSQGHCEIYPPDSESLGYSFAQLRLSAYRITFSGLYVYTIMSKKSRLKSNMKT